MTYDPREQEIVLDTFASMLWHATRDGGRKRARGEKPPWYEDMTHEEHFWNHISAWERGDLEDKDSGAHPLIHAAWRLLAIAYQDTHGHINPEDTYVGE